MYIHTNWHVKRLHDTVYTVLAAHDSLRIPNLLYVDPLQKKKNLDLSKSFSNIFCLIILFF